MQVKLDNKDLEMVSGGLLRRGTDGSYVVYGESDGGKQIELVFAGGKKSFILAVRQDWRLFHEQYDAKGIHTPEDLIRHYNYGDF